MKIRTFTLKDYRAVAEIWKATLGVSPRDTKRRIALLFRKNPRISVVAEEKGKVIGVALGSFDGRKGYINKVAVRSDFRNKGTGGALVAEVTKRLRRAGALTAQLDCKKNLIPFYRRQGFKPKDSVSMRIKFY